MDLTLKPLKNKIMMNIKNWYTTTFPEDELGNEINPTSTFEGLIFEKVTNRQNTENLQRFYDYIGVGDSIVRERVFEKLAVMLNVDYDDIYNGWLYGEKIKI